MPKPNEYKIVYNKEGAATPPAEEYERITSHPEITPLDKFPHMLIVTMSPDMVTRFPEEFPDWKIERSHLLKVKINNPLRDRANKSKDKKGSNGENNPFREV